LCYKFKQLGLSVDKRCQRSYNHNCTTRTSTDEIIVTQKGVSGLFLVNPKSKQPIYEQLVEQLRRHLTMGTLEAGEPMPSVRQLATELGINPNTIQKAYRRMEDEGMITSVPGRGSFVSDDVARMLQKQREEQIEKTRQSLILCRDMGLTANELEQLIKTVYKE